MRSRYMRQHSPESKLRARAVGGGFGGTPRLTMVATERPLPPVTEEAARGDRDWFGDHPSRRFHARAGDGGWWLIRRRGLLRTFTRTVTHVADRDKAIAALWFAAAYPDEEIFGKAVKRGRKAVGGRR
jgi:hypothetical protein